MRLVTKKTYEDKIADLEGQLAEARVVVRQRGDQVKFWQRDYQRLADARRQGEEARQWAIEQAIRAGQPDIVAAATQIADFVFGPDHGADREEESPS